MRGPQAPVPSQLHKGAAVGAAAEGGWSNHGSSRLRRVEVAGLCWPRCGTWITAWLMLRRLAAFDLAKQATSEEARTAQHNNKCPEVPDGAQRPLPVWVAGSRGQRYHAMHMPSLREGAGPAAQTSSTVHRSFLGLLSPLKCDPARSGIKMEAFGGAPRVDDLSSWINPWSSNSARNTGLEDELKSLDYQLGDAWTPKLNHRYESRDFPIPIASEPQIGTRG